jgi:hypothetical protein
MVDIDATLSHHLDQIAQADCVAQIPARKE